MNSDNTQDAAEPSPASVGSPPDAWAVEHGGDIVYVAIQANDAQEWAGGGPVDVVPLYRQPQPTLTDAERESLRFCIRVALPETEKLGGVAGELCRMHRDRLRWLLGRLG